MRKKGETQLSAVSHQLSDSTLRKDSYELRAAGLKAVLATDFAVDD